MVRYWTFLYHSRAAAAAAAAHLSDHFARFAYSRASSPESESECIASLRSQLVAAAAAAAASDEHKDKEEANIGDDVTASIHFRTTERAVVGQPSSGS